MMEKSSMQQPASVYSQGFENQTLKYMSREDGRASKDARQVRKQEYKGRYQ